MKRKYYIFAALLTACAWQAGGENILFPYRRASYTTYFQEGVEREKNIRLAVEKLDSVIIHPGSEFSFNEAVTWQIPRDELGYAPAIIDGELLTASGGGLCQVSSTLYASALAAGMSVTERKNHSSPVGYISPGLDATVSTTEGIDLKLRNDEKYPFLIKASAGRGTLNIVFFSAGPPDSATSISVTLPEKEGRYIYVTTMRKTSVKNGTAATEIISVDRYIN